MEWLFESLLPTRSYYPDYEFLTKCGISFPNGDLKFLSIMAKLLKPKCSFWPALFVEEWKPAVGLLKIPANAPKILFVKFCAEGEIFCDNSLFSTPIILTHSISSNQCKDLESNGSR
jgi:hypothetical protein